jgi:uncharacterized protein (TIGR01777 family)
VTGSTGLIGEALVAALAVDGHRVLRVLRSGAGPSDTVAWDPDAGTIDAAGLEGLDAVVHLAGAPIAGHRWSDAQRARILGSRTRGTTLLAGTLAALQRPPRVLASGSAVGFYGDTGNDTVDEDGPAGTDFLADVVRAWEGATGAAEAAGIRVAHLRTGVVLARAGGVLGQVLLPFRLGLGGRQGSGRQWMSWISRTDEVAAIRHVLDHDDLRGPVNLTAPSPVTNREFAATLGTVLRRPTVLPTPLLPLRLRYGRELVEHLLLVSQRVVPGRLTGSGFTFTHPSLESAIRAELAA